MSESARISEKKPEAAKEDRTSQTRTSDYSQPVNLSIDRILFLQRTIGNQAVGRLIKSGGLQAKLRIGQPWDIYEQEADKVAEQVMQMPDIKMQRCINNKPRKEEEESLRTKEVYSSTPDISPRLVSQINSKVRMERNFEAKNRPPTQLKHTNPLIFPALHSHNHTVPYGESEFLNSLPKAFNLIQMSSSTSSNKSPSPFANAFVSQLTQLYDGERLPPVARTIFEQSYGYDFSQVQIHRDSIAASLANGLGARAFTLGNHIVFN